MNVRFIYKKTDIDEAYLFVSGADSLKKFQNDKLSYMPTMHEKNAGDFLKTYRNILKDWRKINSNNSFFLATPFAIGNTWQSSFFFGLESSWKLNEVIQSNVESKNIIFDDANWFLYERKKHPNVHIKASDILRAHIDKIFQFFLKYKMRYWGVRFLISKTGLWPKRYAFQHNLKVILFSVWTRSGLRYWNEKGIDPFLGKLPVSLETKNVSSGIVFYPQDEGGNNVKAGAIPTMSSPSLLGIIDLLWAIRGIFFFHYNKKCSEQYPSSAIKYDVAQSLQAQIPLTLLAYKASKNALLDNPEAHILHMYENNCWEVGCIMAANEMRRLSFGVQHTAIMPSSIKMEKADHYKYFPDFTITSGQEPARILVDKMRHDENRTIAGCGLRFEYTDSDVKSMKDKSPLILLQGAPNDILMLQKLSAQFKGAEVKVRVRMHPSQTIDMDGFKNFFEVSEHKDLVDDITASSIVIYNGTSAVFEALLFNTPAIYIDLGGALSADPLFGLKESTVKFNWRDGDNLLSLIRHADNIEQDDRTRGFEVAREYIMRYFQPANDVTIDQTIQKIQKAISVG